MKKLFKKSIRKYIAAILTTPAGTIFTIDGHRVNRIKYLISTLKEV